MGLATILYTYYSSDDHHAHYLQGVGDQVGDLGMKLDSFSYLRPNMVSPLRAKNVS